MHRLLKSSEFIDRCPREQLFSKSLALAIVLLPSFSRAKTPLPHSIILNLLDQFTLSIYLHHVTIPRFHSRVRKREIIEIEIIVKITTIVSFFFFFLSFIRSHRRRNLLLETIAQV